MVVFDLIVLHNHKMLPDSNAARRRMYAKMKDYFLARLREPSTWRGLVLLATSFGMTLKPEQSYAIMTLGMALAGATGVVTKDAQNILDHDKRL